MDRRTEYFAQVTQCSLHVHLLNAVKKIHSLQFATSREAERVQTRYNTFLAPSQELFCHFTQMTSYLGNPRNEHELQCSRKLLLTYIQRATTRSAVRSIQRYAPYSTRFCISTPGPETKSIVGCSQYSSAPRHISGWKL
jgi:hypothetical protein